MLDKNKINKSQVDLMESLGFELDSFNSSDYLVYWVRHLYKDNLELDKFTYVHPSSPRLETSIEKVLNSMSKTYYEKGVNSVKGPIRKALGL